MLKFMIFSGALIASAILLLYWNYKIFYKNKKINKKAFKIPNIQIQKKTALKSLSHTSQEKNTTNGNIKKIPMCQPNLEKMKNGITPGSSIRNTRVLRKITIDELATKTGLSEKIIQEAENDSLTLSLSDIEKLAIGLDIHPSHIAFPTWDTIPFKSEKVSVKGDIYINEILDSSDFMVYLNREFGLRIFGKSRKSFNLRTFNGATITSGSYDYSGDNLGTLNDNYGGGSEFDSDSRVIKKLQIKISPCNESIVYFISGLASAEDGNVSEGRPQNAPSGDWNFKIQFEVSKDKIRDFLGIYPEAEMHLLERLSKLQS